MAVCRVYRILSTSLVVPTRSYAEKKVYQRDKPHCNIGTIGHVEHGKTTLTAAITKVLSEKGLANVKRYDELHNAPGRAHIDYATENRHYGHIDCPGHIDDIKYMITGTSQMDGAILVVAATDGVMPQTKEHLFLAKHLGIEHIIVFINKVDTADEEIVECVEMEIRELMTEMGYDGNNVPLVKGSALAAIEGNNEELGEKAVMELMELVDQHIPTPVRELDKPFMMSVKRVFSITGRGTIVSGRIDRGRLKKGMDCEVIGHNKNFKSTITSIEMCYQTLEEAQAGDLLDALVRGLKRDDAKRGMVLAEPGTVKSHDNVEGNVYMLTKEDGGWPKPFTSYQQMQLHIKTWDQAAQVIVSDKETVIPGEDAKINLRLFKPMVLEKGQRFILRIDTTTVCTGVITNIGPDMNEVERAAVVGGKKASKKLLGKAAN